MLTTLRKTTALRAAFASGNSNRWLGGITSLHGHTAAWRRQRQEEKRRRRPTSPLFTLSPTFPLLLAAGKQPTWSIHSLYCGRAVAPVMMNGTQLRYFSYGRNPWQRHDWVSTVKTGALVALGAGVLVASTSFAFGLIMAGAAGYGIYSLYQKVFGPYRSRNSDPFGGVNSDIESILNQAFGNKRQQHREPTYTRSSNSQRELDSLVEGLPLIVRGIVKTIFSFVGSAMQSSMERAGELRRLANERLQSNDRVRSLSGGNVSISTPQQWMETTVNGVGRIEAVFPVIGGSPAQVTVKASVGQSNQLNLKELKYRNYQTGEVIDLLHDSGSSIGGQRKIIVDAEYVDIDEDKGRSSRW